jgi:hypothetical protein
MKCLSRSGLGDSKEKESLAGQEPNYLIIYDEKGRDIYLDHKSPKCKVRTVRKTNKLKDTKNQKKGDFLRRSRQTRRKPKLRQTKKAFYQK